LAFDLCHDPPRDLLREEDDPSQPPGRWRIPWEEWPTPEEAGEGVERAVASYRAMHAACARVLAARYPEHSDEILTASVRSRARIVVAPAVPEPPADSGANGGGASGRE
jgi:hypothetical protein